MDILPLEIRRKIFQYLEQKDLQTCYFVCQSWYSIAIPLNWEEVILNRIQIDLVKSHLTHFDHGRYFKYGHLILKLTIKDLNFSPFENRIGFSKLELLELLEQFPNLMEIDLSESCHFKEYLEFLFVTKMQYIKKITGPFNPYSEDHSLCNLLFLVYYRFRESITCMNLLYVKSTVTFHSEKINVLDSLAQFKKLTELVFYNKGNTDLTPFQLQKTCPNLKLLKFASDYPIPERVVLQLPNKNLNFISSLTNLCLRLPSLSATYTRYLADYLPNQLTVLNIGIRAQNMFDWINLVGMELASRLMEKVDKLKEVSIYFKLSDRLEAPNGHENRITKFFKLLNAFRKTPRSYCKAIFHGNYDNRFYGKGYSFSYTPNGILSFKYDLRVGHIFSLNFLEENSSVINPKVFGSLEFDISGVNNDVTKPILIYSLLNCPKIKSFNLLGNGGEEKSFYLQYRHKKNSISSKATRRNINYLEIAYINPVRCLLDLVSTYLLDIETISFKIEDKEILDGGMVIDLTSFKKLNTFTAEIEDDSGYGVFDDYKRNLIVIKYTDGEKKYYYLDQKEYRELNEDIDYPLLTILCNAGVSFDFYKNRYG